MENLNQQLMNKKHTLWVEKFRPFQIEGYLGNDSFISDLKEWISKQDFPNLLLHGGPGTGKTTMAELVSMASGLLHLNVSDLIMTRKLVSEWDESLNTWVLDEDKLIHVLEEDISKGGLVLDYHGVDLFPQDWFDLVVVLTTDNTILYSRLEDRSYSDYKIQENVTAEIMQVILQEANDYFQDKVWQMTSDTLKDMDQNCEQVLEWIDNFKQV